MDGEASNEEVIAAIAMKAGAHKKSGEYHCDPRDSNQNYTSDHSMELSPIVRNCVAGRGQLLRGSEGMGTRKLGFIHFIILCTNLILGPI